MPTYVASVTDYSRKCWNCYSGPVDDFREKNVLFGHNGNGKSTLAEGVRDEFLLNGGGLDGNVRYFNRSYIDDYLLLDDTKGELRGVKADFSKGNVGIEKKLSSLSEEKEKIEIEIAKLDDSVATQHAVIEKAVDEVLRRRKGTAKINSKSTKDGIEAVLTVWQSDYQTAKKKFPEHDFATTVGNDAEEKTLAKMQQISLPALAAVSIEALSHANEIFGKQYEDIDIPSAVVVEWLDQGLTIHKDACECKFCGGSLDLDTLTKRVESYKNAERTKDERFLASLRNDIDSFVNALVSVVDNQAEVESLVADPCLSESYKTLESKKECFDTVIELVAQKLDDMDSVHSIDCESLAEDQRVIIERIKGIQASFESAISMQNAKVDNMNVLVKGAIGFELGKNSVICSALSRIDSERSSKKSVSERLDQIIQERRSLEESKSNVSDFAQFLNTVFDDISLPFHLECTDGHYIIKLVDSSKTLALKDISEGERNLIAILFFFFELYKDKDQKEMKQDIKLIIVDDPTTSMDDQNKFYVLEIMKHILREQAQVFIFTHLWDDFCNLSYGNDGDNWAFLEAKKISGESTLCKCKSNITPYKRLFREIYNFTEMNVDDPMFDSASVHMSNAMRRVLEEYIRFNSSISLVSSGKEQGIGEVLFPGKNWENDVSARAKTKVSLLISVTNILSHRTPKSLSSSEIKQCACFLLNRIKEINKTHYDAMKN